RGAAQRGVFQHEHAALGLLGRNQPASVHQMGTHAVVAPERWLTGRTRLWWHQLRERLPERRQVLAIDASIKLFALGRVSWADGHLAPSASMPAPSRVRAGEVPAPRRP